MCSRCRKKECGQSGTWEETSNLYRKKQVVIQTQDFVHRGDSVNTELVCVAFVRKKNFCDVTEDGCLTVCVCLC